jgi:serine/threonine-protein kinase
VGPYALLRQIGAGGTARVFLAQHPESDAPIALKVLPLGAECSQRLRFEREARALMALDHPNIVRLLDYGIDDEGNGYIAMMYVGGGTLKQRMRERFATRQLFTIAEVLAIGQQIGSALHVAHCHKLIHRDIKPANILIVDDESEVRYVLTDFGLVLDGQATRMTWNEPGMGTPEYMAPEQITPHCTVDARTDVYALGMVLYEMLTGRAPFAAEEPLTTLYKHVHEDAPDLRRYRPNVPASVVEAIMHAIARDPRQRFASAAQFVAALETSSKVTLPRSHTIVAATAFSATAMLIAVVVGLLALLGEPLRSEGRTRIASAILPLGAFIMQPTAIAISPTPQPTPIPTKTPRPTVTPAPQVIVRFSVEEDAEHNRLLLALGKPMTMEWNTLGIISGTLQVKPDVGGEKCPAGKRSGIVARGLSLTNTATSIQLPAGRAILRFVATGRYRLSLQLMHRSGDQTTFEREIRVNCGGRSSRRPNAYDG